MAHCEQLSAIESRIRGAVASGAYQEATLLLSSYSKQLETELQNSYFPSGQLAEEMVRANEFLEWIFRMVAAAKAHDTAQLTELQSIAQYYCSEADQLHSWRLEA